MYMFVIGHDGDQHDWGATRVYAQMRGPAMLGTHVCVDGTCVRYYCLEAPAVMRVARAIARGQRQRLRGDTLRRWARAHDDTLGTAAARDLAERVTLVERVPAEELQGLMPIDMPLRLMRRDAAWLEALRLMGPLAWAAARALQAGACVQGAWDWARGRISPVAALEWMHERGRPVVADLADDAVPWPSWATDHETLERALCAMHQAYGSAVALTRLISDVGLQADDRLATAAVRGDYGPLAAALDALSRPVVGAALHRYTWYTDDVTLI